jgi:hypothetical protein
MAVFWPRNIFGGDSMRVRVGLDGDGQRWKKNEVSMAAYDALNLPIV